jgi:hypothetical protein
MRYLAGRAQTIFLLACMTIPLFYLLLDSYQVDFRAFYVAAASASKHLNPYVDNRSSGDQFTDPTNQLESSRWVYPPSALFFVAPFAKLRYTPARLIFGLLSLGSLAWVLLYLSGKFKVADSWVIAAYVSVPVMACLERGQIDLFMMFLLVLSFAGGRRFWAGVPLGIAISIKIFPAAILLWLLLERRLREAVTALVVVAAIVLLSVWRYGTAGYVEFRRNLADLAPGQQLSQKVDLIHKFGGLVVDDRWLALTHGFIGSYNNPLVLLRGSGVIVALVLVVAIAIWLRYKRVSPEIGFFTVVLASQLLNTRLWTMGMVLYLPICIVAIGKARSTLLTCLLLVPLFLPSQIRLLGVSPRLMLALAIVAYVVYRETSAATVLVSTDHPA